MAGPFVLVVVGWGVDWGVPWIQGGNFLD
jgi:hypothetical protein